MIQVGPRSTLKNNGFNFKDKSKPKVPSSDHFTLKVGYSEVQKVCQGPFLISTERLWALDLTSVQWSKVKLRGGLLQSVPLSKSQKTQNRHKTHTHTHTHTHTDTHTLTNAPNRHKHTHTH